MKLCQVREDSLGILKEPKQKEKLLFLSAGFSPLQMPKLGKYQYDEDARLGSGGEGDVY